MKRIFTFAITALALIAAGGGVHVCAAPQMSFVEPPTPADGETVIGSSVEIEVSITESALSDVMFNWNGTDYVIYDNSTVLMFNLDNLAALGEDYSIVGGLVRDLSIWANDGIAGIPVEPPALPDPTTVPEWIPDGRYGGACDFAGNGSTYGQSILVIPHDSSLNPDAGDFAIAVWVRPRSDIDGDILRKGSTGTATTWYKLEHSPGTPNNRFSLNFNTDAANVSVSSPQAYNDDQWHFVVAQRRGNTAELWIDGSLVASAGVSGSISNTANLTVGSKDTQADDFINATLDEVRIYMRSFTEDQMQVLYHSNLSRVGLDTWYLYVNQTNLVGGTYIYQVSATNTSSDETIAERSVTMDAPPIAADITKGPYLQQVTENSMVIMWETDVAADSRVDYSDGTNQYVDEDTTLVTIHEMQLANLANTAYSYTVTSGTATSPASTFATAPAGAESFRFVAYGDTRSQPVEHAAVIQGIISSVPEIVIHTGDLVTDGTNYNLWETEFFDPAYGLMIYTPLLPILGNHENNASWFYDLFSLPNNEQWYAFTYGNARFIGLNTCTDYTSGSSQYNWLVSELQSSAYSNATWHIVYFHHPPYSATSVHGDDANVKRYLVPLFEQNGVDVVFSGHSHAYERYLNNGIYYIVTGGGGAPLAGLVTDNQNPIRQYGESVLHHCAVDVDSSSLTLSARYNDGWEFDTVTITKTAKASNPSPANGAENVPVDAVLSWKAGTDAVSHDVYFGTNPAELPLVSQQSGTAYDPPGTLANNTTYYWVIDEHNSDLTVTDGDLWSFTTARCVANADIRVAGTVSGSYVDTQSSDGIYEAITERESGGKPSRRHSYLEHKWTFNVPSGDTVTFYVEAHHTSNSEGDDFVFAYSTDDSTYSPMLTVSKTGDDNTYQSYVLPSSATGTVYVSVVDIDASQGNRLLDTIYVDDMYISSEGGGVPDTDPPTPDPTTWETLPYAVGSTSISMTATTASDPSGVEYYFNETSGNPGGTDSGWQDSPTYEDTGLQPNTGYAYQVSARDKSSAQNETGPSTAESATTQESALPEPAANPSPADGATGLNRKAVILSWTAGVGATSHDVYLGTNPTPGAGDLKGNQTGTSYDPRVLRKGMTYYWRIDEVNSDGTTPGPVWSFTTQ